MISDGQHHLINVKRWTHYQTTVTDSFILIAWKLQILGWKNIWGVHLTSPLHVRGLIYHSNSPPLLLWSCVLHTQWSHFFHQSIVRIHYLRITKELVNINNCFFFKLYYGVIFILPSLNTPQTIITISHFHKQVRSLIFHRKNGRSNSGFKITFDNSDLQWNMPNLVGYSILHTFCWLFSRRKVHDSIMLLHIWVCFSQL